MSFSWLSLSKHGELLCMLFVLVNSKVLSEKLHAKDQMRARISAALYMVPN